MSTSPRRPNRIWRIVRPAIPWILTLAIFAALFGRIPVARVVDSLAAARWGLYLLLMVPYSVCYFLLDTAAITLAVRRFHAPVRYRDLLPVRAVTYVLALVNSNVGNGGLALWLHRRERVPFLAIAGTMLFLAFLEISQLVLWSSVGWSLEATPVPGLGTAYAVLYSILALLIGYFVALPMLGVERPAPGLLATLGRARPGDYVLLLLVKTPSLLLAIVVHWIGLQLFGMEIPLVVLLANLPLIFLASALPLTVAKLGTSQLAWAYLLGSWAPEAGLVAYSLAAHVMFLVMNALIGVTFLPGTGPEILALAGDARADGSTPEQG